LSFLKAAEFFSQPSGRAPAEARVDMSNTQTLERSQQTGLSDSTHSSSSSSAERYQLDEADSSPILLYKYRGGLQTSSQKDLCSWLDKGE